jgi:hypothetical protein
MEYIYHIIDFIAEWVDFSLLLLVLFNQQNCNYICNQDVNRPACRTTLI